MRVFIGLELNETWRAALAAGRDLICAREPGWAEEKWVPAENLHVTLKFMGDIADESVGFLGPDLSEALGAMRRFELPLHRALLPSPEASRASMLWTTLRDPDGTALELLSAIEDVASSYGVVPESRHFHPHITLVRARTPRAITTVDAAADAIEGALGSERSMSVPSVTVFRSTLTKYRPLYERLATVDLAD